MKLQDAKFVVDISNKIEYLEHQKALALKGEIFDVSIRGGAFPQFGITSYEMKIPLIEMKDAAIKILVDSIDKEVEQLSQQIKNL